MPITKCEASKATPLKGLTYIMDKNKTLATGSQLLLKSDPEGMAAQMLQTMHLHGKGWERDERKYYHTKVSFDPADLPENGGNLTPAKANLYAAKYAAETWPGREVAWSVQQHEPGKPMHIHFIVAACDQETGKKLDARDAEYRKWKTRANTLAKSMGLSTINWEQAVKAKRQREIQAAEPVTETHAEEGLKARGKTTWKDELRAIIDAAAKESRNLDQFKAALEAKGVTLTRCTAQTISYKLGDHKACRGDTLGGDYTMQAILDTLKHNKEHPSLVDPDYRPSLQAKLDATKTGADPDRVISLDERQKIRELGRLAGVKRADIDRWCDMAPKATWEEKQQVWDDYKASKTMFWDEYAIRQQALRDEISEAYRKRRMVKNMEWMLNPRNRRSSLIGIIIAAIFLARNDDTFILDIKIGQLKREQEALRKEMAAFKAASGEAVETLREKGLTLDAYAGTVRGMQNMADQLYMKNARLSEKDKERMRREAAKAKAERDRKYGRDTR